VSKKVTPTCAKCGVYRCHHPEVEADYPAFCPHENYADVRKASIEEGWKKPENRRVNQACDEVLNKQGDQIGNYTWCRVKEVIEYSKEMGYKKLGLGFCVGLKDEARVLTNVLENNGFEVVSVACMSGAPTRDEVGFEKYPYAGNVICNPITQAEVLNREKTELNIMLGLCLGHDILFIRYSKADVTPLAVKDRILAHNPLGALYTSQGYYQKRLYPRR
jgi:uncharacterized metal-binding protein